MPQTGARAWPGRLLAANVVFEQKAPTVERALLEDIAAKLGSNVDAGRFIPYVMMHEFEGMLFSDCHRFGIGIGRPELAPKLFAIRNEFRSPEEINDSPQTAPSKRLEALIPAYQKPLLGNLAAIEIGLETIRNACPHFSEWLEQLENWAST